MKTQELKTLIADWKNLELLLMEDSQLCKELDIHASTSRRWRRKKKVRFLRIDRKIYYRISDLLPFISSLNRPLI